MAQVNTRRQDKDLLQAFFKGIKAKHAKCSYPFTDCKNTPCKAHSIQNGGPIDLLSLKNHVIMPQMKATGQTPPTIEFKEIGRNNATTFTGLCSDHDTELFQEIENGNELDLTNPKHIFLFALRSVLKEYHAVCEAAVRTQTVYQTLIDSGKEDPDKQTPMMMQATGQLINAHTTFMYKQKIDELFIQSEWDKISHIQLSIPVGIPTVAVCSMFEPVAGTSANDDIVGLHINIFPRSEDHFVLFTFLPEHRDMLMPYIQPLIDSTGYYQQYLLTKMVLKHCENLVLSPAVYDSFPEEQKDAISRYINASLAHDSDFDDTNLFLFATLKP